MIGRLLFTLLCSSIGALEIPAQAQGEDAKTKRVIGKVFFDGKGAKGFLVVLENKSLDVLRNESSRVPWLISRTVGVIASPFGLGPIQATSAIYPKVPEKPIEWAIHNKEFSPDHIVVQKLQPILITWKDPKTPRLIEYLSGKQHMPGPFQAFDFFQKPTFVFYQHETGILVRDAMNPTIEGYISVLDHKNYAFTDSDGTFELRGQIQKGKYELWVSHPRFGSLVQEIDVPMSSLVELRLFPVKKKRSIPVHKSEQ